LATDTKYFASGAAFKNVKIDVIVHEYDIRDQLTTLESALSVVGTNLLIKVLDLFKQKKLFLIVTKIIVH